MSPHSSMTEHAAIPRFVPFKIRCRPRRALVLVETPEGWEGILEAIARLSGVWGGWYSTLAPATAEGFEAMLPVLREFDPDDVFAVKPEGVGDGVREMIRRYLSPFRTPFKAAQAEVRALGETDGYCSMASARELLGLESILQPVPPEGMEAPLLALLYSHTGYWPRTLTGLPNPEGLQVIEHPLPSEPTLDYLVGGQSPLPDAGTPDRVLPFPATLAKLNIWHDDGMTSPPDRLVVWGNTSQDFCLYYTLSRLRGGVFWIPLPLPADVEEQANTGDQWLDGYVDHCLWRVVRGDSYDHEPHITITSLSVPHEEMDGSRDRLLEFMKRKANRVEAPPIELHMCPLSDTWHLLPSVWCVAEAEWRPPVSLPVVEGRLQVNPTTPAPAFEREPKLYREDWVVDVIPEEGSMLAHSEIVVGEPAGGRTPRASRGAISYAASPVMHLGGVPTQAALVRPRLRLPSACEMGEVLLRTLVEKAGLSDAGRYQRTFVEVFGGLPHAAEVLRNPPYTALFDRFARAAPEERKRGWGDNACFSRDVWYLSKKEMDKVVAGASKNEEGGKRDLDPILRDLLQREVLSRGFVLKCEMCAFEDWYAFGEFGQTFTCRRCSAVSQYQPAPPVLYRLYEPVRHAISGNCNCQVPILALDALREMARGRFSFCEALALEDAGCEGLLGDLDLFAVVNGRLWVGEAKKQARLSCKAAKGLVALCEQLRPEVLVLATGGKQWNPRITEPLREQLVRIGTWVVPMSKPDLDNPGQFAHKFWHTNPRVHPSSRGGE